MILLVTATMAAPLEPAPSSTPSVAGFRMPVVDPGAYADTRVALVRDFDGPFIAEWTLRGQATFGHFGIAGDLAVAGGASELWSDLAFGNAAVELRGVFGNTNFRHAIGLRGTLPVGAFAEHGALYWGTVPTAIVPTLGAAVFFEAATGRFSGRAHLGFSYGGAFGLFDAGMIVAIDQPIGGAWAFVGEFEVISGPSNLHLRALVRRGLGRAWTADLGLAAPVPSIVTDPSIQVLLRVAAFSRPRKGDAP